MKHYSKMLTGRPAHVIFLENDNPRNPLNEPVAIFARHRSFPGRSQSESFRRPGLGRDDAVWFSAGSE
ncbi:hypothetical protein B5T_01631 [Alloalcanivorax dieselolei B5]|uniref:Uncharacterized protein n=1 Tax=Alcanivorax dieselolei (strain DSM 16502 / CGMCC 1.3690 / MCCC 1A00001 / B-5) TaxID=930169 RepID=K0CBR3_ALCDB|nr:hypothetical protein B5T_01631 [Alloalcanivorax dieselolei B5]